MARSRHRGKKVFRKAHPKIFVWSHTEKAEIDYFQEFKDCLKTPLLMPEKFVCRAPQDLLEHVKRWMVSAVKSGELVAEDNDQIWCVFDVDDFYENDSKGLLNAIKNAETNGIKIAFINECFEHWILFHFI